MLFTLAAKDGEKYTVRNECSGYPETAPSVVFVNADGSKSDAKAWPTGDGEFTQIVHGPPECFMCTSLTREGLAHHNDWKNDASKNPWHGAKHNLMSIFNLVSRLLNGRHYTGRRTG